MVYEKPQDADGVHFQLGDVVDELPKFFKVKLYYDKDIWIYRVLCFHIIFFERNYIFQIGFSFEVFLSVLNELIAREMILTFLTLFSINTSTENSIIN